MIRRKMQFLYILTFLFPMLELAKQLYLVCFVFAGRSYDVWYFPFQLCSMPMYLLLLLRLIPAEKGLLPGNRRRKNCGFFPGFRGAALSYIRDFGMLGGIAALLVNDGFTGTGHLFLTVHGFLWHILMILASLSAGLSPESTDGSSSPDVPFRGEALLFLLTAGIAFLLNILLHSFGDCDMFYISPWHLSSQPVFHEIDAVVGRPAGICIYLAAVLLGGWLVRYCYLLFKNFFPGGPIRF